MDKYKINYIFKEEKDINEIFIKVLNQEIEKNIQIILNNKKYKTPLSQIDLV